MKFKLNPLNLFPAYRRHQEFKRLAARAKIAWDFSEFSKSFDFKHFSRHNWLEQYGILAVHQASNLLVPFTVLSDEIIMRPTLAYLEWDGTRQREQEALKAELQGREEALKKAHWEKKCLDMGGRVCKVFRANGHPGSYHQLEFKLGMGPCGRNVIRLQVQVCDTRRQFKIIQWCDDNPDHPDIFYISMDDRDGWALYTRWTIYQTDKPKVKPEEKHGASLAENPLEEPIRNAG